MNIRIGHSDWSKSSAYESYIHPTKAWLLSSPSLPSRQVNMADSCWMEFSIIRKTSLQVQNIWQDGEFSKWLLSPLDQKSFQELVLKAFRNRKRSGCANRQQVRWIDQNLFFFKLNKLLIFRRWWQLWMRSTMIKQKYGMNLFFVVFRLFVLLPNLLCKLIHNGCKLLHVGLLLKLWLHACMQTNCLF